MRPKYSDRLDKASWPNRLCSSLLSHQPTFRESTTSMLVKASRLLSSFSRTISFWWSKRWKIRNSIYCLRTMVLSWKSISSTFSSTLTPWFPNISESMRLLWTKLRWNSSLRRIWSAIAWIRFTLASILRALCLTVGLNWLKRKSNQGIRESRFWRIKTSWIEKRNWT